MTKGLFPLLSLGLLLGCPPKVVTDDTGGQDDTGDTSGSPTGQTQAAVVTTDYAVYGLATVDLQDWQVTDEVSTLPGSSSLKVLEDGLIYNLNSWGVDTVRVYEPGSFEAPLLEFSVGDGSVNPHDLALCAGKLFVTQYGTNTISAHDPETGALVGTVDLSAFDDGDGSGEPDQLVKVGESLFVGLNQLDQNNGWVASGGTLAEIDCSSLEVTQSWSVGPNPRIYAHPVETGSLVILTGIYFTDDGGLSVFSVADGVQSELVTEAELQADINDFVGIASGRALLLTSSTDDNGATQSVRCMDLEDGATTVAESASNWFASAAVNDRGEAWISARAGWEDPEVPGGILVYDIESCSSANPGDWIGFSLDPETLVFY